MKIQNLFEDMKKWATALNMKWTNLLLESYWMSTKHDWKNLPAEIAAVRIGCTFNACWYTLSNHIIFTYKRIAFRVNVNEATDTKVLIHTKTSSVNLPIPNTKRCSGKFMTLWILEVATIPFNLTLRNQSAETTDIMQSSKIYLQNRIIEQRNISSRKLLTST